ncbi:hypothetical protein BS17DRAFT_773513, partial [Gyrodon lividus]
TASPVPRTSVTTNHIITVSNIHGHLMVVQASKHIMLAPETTFGSSISPSDLTWALRMQVLQVAIGLLWKQVSDHNIQVTNLLSIPLTPSVPYKSAAGLYDLCCEAGTAQLAALKGKNIASDCPICGQSTTDLQSHVGVAKVVMQPIVGKPECALSFKEMKCKVEWKTQCPHAHPFQYTSAYKGSDNWPCRNVPLVCKLCYDKEGDTDKWPAHWQYNMKCHLNYQHSKYACPGKPNRIPLPCYVYDTIYLTSLEEKKAGMPICPPFTRIVNSDKQILLSANPCTQKH